MISNSLYYGDNLDILRRYVQTESVDLIYLDHPFKGNQTYNVLFQEKDGSQSASQIKSVREYLVLGVRDTNRQRSSRSYRWRAPHETEAIVCAKSRPNGRSWLTTALSRPPHYLAMSS